MRCFRREVVIRVVRVGGKRVSCGELWRRQQRKGEAHGEKRRCRDGSRSAPITSVAAPCYGYRSDGSIAAGSTVSCGSEERRTVMCNGMSNGCNSICNGLCNGMCNGGGSGGPR